MIYIFHNDSRHNEIVERML